MIFTQFQHTVVKMKKCGYKDNHFPSTGEKQEEIDGAKHEDVTLPLFSKEVPVSSRRYEAGENVVVEYSWKKTKSPSIKIKKLVYRKEENLGNLHRIHRKDGCDRLSIVLNGKTYILRKTLGTIAEALYRASSKIRASLEEIVGYLQTIFGNYYVISAVEDGAWSFDREVAFGGISYMELENLKTPHKKRLLDLIVEKLSELHSENLMLGRFSLRNILISNNGLTFTDLRNMRVSRKKSLLVSEFKNVMKYLASVGIMGREDVDCAVAYYSSENEQSCREWYSENFRKEPSDGMEIATKMERDIVD
jgi:hypothetical protein